MKIPPPLPLIAGYSVNKKANAVKQAEEEYKKKLTNQENQEREKLLENQKLQVARSAYGFLGTLVLASAATIATGPLALAFGAGVAIMSWRTIVNARKLDKETEKLSQFSQRVDQRRAAQASSAPQVSKPWTPDFGSPKFAG